MRVTQGCFSYLPDLTDEQISKHIQYCLDNGWAVSLEYTDDPHPRNTYWEMWGHPMFDIRDAKAIMANIRDAAAHAIPTTAFATIRDAATHSVPTTAFAARPSPASSVLTKR